MKIISLFTVAPAGSARKDYEDMEKFTAELNRFFNKFNLQVDLTAYGMKLPVRKGGDYSVKALQSPLMGKIRKSELCCIIFFCKKEEVAADEMSVLVRSLIQQRKAEIAVYFKPNENMQPVRNDIMRRIQKIDERNPLSKEDQKHLSDMAKNFVNYGCVCDRGNKLKEAESAYREAMVIQRKLVTQDEDTWLPDLSLPYHNLGTLYFRTKRYKEAEMMLKEAIKTRKLLIEKKGDVYESLLASTYVNLGSVYISTERFDEAEKVYLEALKIREKTADQADDTAKKQFADLCSNLGHLYNRTNRMDEAKEKYESALDIELKLLDQQYENELAQKAARLSNTLGVTYLKENNAQEAEEWYLKSFKLYTKLSEENADAFEPPLAMVCYNLSNIYSSMKQPEEAAGYLEKAYEICSRRKDRVPMCKELYDAMNAAKKQAMEKSADIVRLLEQKGKEEQEKGQYEEAIQSYEQAAGLYEEMEASEYQAKAALLYNELGLLHWDLDQLEKAEESYQTSLKLYRKMAEEDDSHLPDVAIACYNLGIFYEETTGEEGNAYLREAFEIAGQYRYDNVQCQEIYENLEEEPLYGEEGMKKTENAGQEIEKADQKTDQKAEKDGGSASSSDGWLKKLFGRK